MMKQLKKEEGSVIMIVALLLPILIGFIGIAIDGGLILYHKKYAIQFKTTSIHRY